jgi:hypothetical protein
VKRHLLALASLAVFAAALIYLVRPTGMLPQVTPMPLAERLAQGGFAAGKPSISASSRRRAASKSGWSATGASNAP